MAILTKPHPPYAGSFTVRDAALYLRATTPSPETPVRMWRPRPGAFAASSRALYSWIRLGMDWHEPVPVTTRDRVVTFEDLVRLRMIALLRSRGIRYKAIRQAEDVARKITRSPQPFVTEALWTDGSDVFMAFSRALIALTRHGQIALPTLQEYLTPAHHGLYFDRSGIAETWSPHPSVIIDPKVQFGAPCIEGTRVETEAIWAFSEAGETTDSLARMYRLSPKQVRSAIEWEQNVDLAR